MRFGGVGGLAASIGCLWLGCSADTEGLEPGSTVYTCEHQGAQVPEGMFYADGCNECQCRGPASNASCDGGVCQGTCTSGACLRSGDAGPGDGPLWSVPKETCGPADPCDPNGVCFYLPGCEAPRGRCGYTAGWCQQQGSNPEPWSPGTPPTPVQFCGCDGVTYQALPVGGCPLVPYATVGACP